MMFEKKIISLLNKLLKPFIDGIDENTLHLRNILSGKVVLTGLRLKPNIVHSLGLPYHMTFGLIDDVSLTIHLPLLSLSKRKLVIEINNVIMLLTALPESQWDPAQYREEHFTNKVATLAAESLQQVVTEIEGGGFIWRTVLSLLENLEVRINNIHLRVEDYTTNPRLSYAFGCVVKKALFLTGVDPATQAKRDAARDTPFHRSFYNDGNMLHPNVIHRRIEVSEVGVYIDRLDPLRPGMMPSDSVRNGPLSDGASLHPEENIYAPAPDAEDPLFMDARSHGSCNSARFGNVGSSGYIHFVRVSRRPGPSYCAARKNKACRKEFRIKCCRPGDAPRNRLRFVRYSLDPLLQESLCPPRPVNALACTNALFGGLISRIMAHLSSGDHTADCEGGNRTGWQQRSQRTLTRAARRSRRSSGNIFTAGYNRLNAVLAEGKHMGKKDRAMHRGLRRLLPDMRPLVRDRHHPLTPSGLPAGSSNTGSGTRRCGSHLCCGACLCCDGASACSSRTDADASLANSLGYTLSSGSTWRILLSTFCEIRQPEEEHQYECLEMINKAQARYIHRHRGKNCDSPRDDCTIRHLNSNVSVKLPNDKPKRVMEFVAAPVNDATEKPDEPTAEGLDPSDTAESSRCFGICSNGDCVLSEGDTDAFDESEYNADRNAPLSYDETWHTQGLDGGTMHTNPQDGDTQDSDADSSKGENDPGYPKNFKPVGESWTRFTFMMNPKEDPAMKELFFRLLDEANHNYVINPKECNGVVSFYFCVYPIRPAIRPRSCWSEWGRRHDSKLYKESIALAKEYLPTCSVFVHLEGLNVIISKDQLECLFNLLFEGIVKYFSWQSGIIHTVEHPRPTPEDEQLYMEYWPQHLLLGQSSQKSEIREFIMDFEILHSIQATRILRKNTSEALRKLIHTFGDRTSSCFDARGCLTDVLLTNICGNCDLDETDPEDDKEEHSRLQARLKLVGGIYEIATKHAKTNAFLDSLRKICQPSMLTFDFTLDVILTESRVALTFEVEPRETNSLSAKAYVFSTKGLHVFFTDVYGRDGCQVIEGELLPFSVVNFAFSIDHHNAEYHSLNDCPCQFLDAPATLLLACGDTPVPKDTAPAGVNNIPGTTVPRHSRISDVIFRSISDSNMYIGISFNRYCTPNDADVRLLFNLNCDLFGHLNLLDEYGDYLRMKKHNQSQNDTVSPVLVGAQKKIYQLSQDSTGCYNEVYELIDLGGEYYRNLLQGSLPYMNLYMFMEVSNQVALFVGACSKYSRLPYVLTVDSFAMTSDITPRQYEPQAEPPYDSHLARASNIRLMSVNGDYSFLVDGGRREVYLGHGTTVKLSDYLAMACSTTRRRGCNDPVIALSLSKLQNNFEILSLGRDNEIFVKVKRANSLYSKHDVPSTIITTNLGSVYISLRECDLLNITETYANYMKMSNDYEEYISRVGGYNPSRASNDLGVNLQGHGFNPACNEETETATSTPTFSARRRKYLSDFRAVVSQKWQDLQPILKQRSLHRSSSTLYQLKLDYLFFEIRRPISLELPYKHSPTSSDDEMSPSEASNSSPSVQWPSSAQYGRSPTRRESLVIPEEVEMARMVIIPTVQAGTYNQTSTSPAELRRNSKYAEGWSTSDSANASSRRATVYNIQSVLSRYGVSVPLLSLKVTGIGLKTCSSDHGIQRLRAFIGCVEVEDQTNSVPLYLSTMVKGGDTTLFWRWLKVSREVHRLRSSLYSYSDGMNHIMNELMDREGTKHRCGRLNPKSKILKNSLYHIDYSKIDFDYKLSHEYQEERFFELKTQNSYISKAYLRVENYLESVMEYNRASDIHVQSSHLSSYMGLPCLMTASIDFDECQRGRCVVAFSSTMVNISWEIMDELLGLCTRVAEKASQIPAAFNTHTGCTSEAVNLDTTINVAQSNINVLCDSAWFGYRNFVDYMWYKLLRDSFNVVDAASVSCSRACSIAETAEMRSSIYMAGTDRPYSQRGVISHSSVTGSISSLGGETVLTPIKSLLDKRRDHHHRISSKDSFVTYGKSGSMDHQQGTFNSHLMWSFMSSIIKETYRRSYMITPIYMHLSGRGTIFISVRACERDTTPAPDFIQIERPSGLHRTSHTISPNTHILDGYPPLRLYMRSCGSNIFASFSKSFNNCVLAPCGYISPQHPKSVTLTEEHKRQQYDFMKYISSRRKRDLKLYGLLESSKHTLYDLQEPVDSRFIEPFRMELCASVLNPDQGLINLVALPQSVCFTLQLQTVKISLSCIDVLSLYSVLGIVNGCMDMQCSDEFVDDFMDARSVGSSIAPESVHDHLSQNKIIYDNNSTGEEYYSCVQSASESDWVSVASSNNGNDQYEINCFPERKYPLMKKPVRRQMSSIQIGFLEKLLSQVSIGIKINCNLLYIEVSSNATNDLSNIFSLTLEDLGCYLWANGPSSLPSPDDPHPVDVSYSTILDNNKPAVNESPRLSSVYTTDIDNRISLCIAGAHSMLSQCCSTDENHKCPIKRTKRLRPSDSKSQGSLPFDSSKMFSSDQPLVRFESHLSITVDVCRDLRREMLLEPVVICLRGSKATLSAKTLTNISTSWINTNISLNGAQCVFSFLKYISEMARLRTVLVEESDLDYKALQPAAACQNDKDLIRSVVPMNIIKHQPQLHKVAEHPPSLGLLNHKLPIWEIPAAVEFRLQNNLLHRTRYLDVHACILEAVRSLGLLKLEGDQERGAIFVGDDVTPLNHSSGGDSTTNGERSRESYSELVNSLGQPIALCLYIDPAFDRSEENEWRVIEDGGRCELPVGHYGIILPFVVRIQLNNCIYEIPSSMLNLTQEDEMMFRLDVSRNYQRGRNMNRMAFLRTMRQERLGVKMYRFGVSMGCTRFAVDDPNGSKDSCRGIQRRQSIKGWGHRVVKKFKKLGRTGAIPLHLFDHDELKYAYVMVRTQPRVGGTVATGASVANRFTIQLSSTLWISNHSHENLVVFPSVSMDNDNRLIPSSSLVWLSQHSPFTSAYPLSNKTVECNKAIDVVKAVGNNIFKQFTSIQENKHPMKHLLPAHVVSPNKLTDDISSRNHDFRLQHIVLNELSYKNQRISIPLSWTIEPECTICVCLQEDFPLDLESDDTSVEVNRGEHKAFEFMSEIHPYFTGDVLLSSRSARHLYQSFELPRVKTPVPDYIARVSLGHLGPHDIFASDFNTGFVQDINTSRKTRDAFRARSISSARMVKSASHSMSRGSISNDSQRLSLPNSISLTSDTGVMMSRLGSGVVPAGSSDGDTAVSQDSADVVTEGEPELISNNLELPLGALTHEMIDEAALNNGVSPAFVVRSRTFARLSTITDKNDSSPSTGLVLKSRIRVEHTASMFGDRSEDSMHRSKTSLDVPDLEDRLPKSILSATLIEVTSSSRSRFGTKLGRSGIRHFEIALESCHVIENMMPFDVHILSPATYDYLNRYKPSEGLLIEDVPLYPISIKACSRSRFSWYMKNGRFVLKELLSREFNLKAPTDTVDVSRLVFDWMQPNFHDALTSLLDNNPASPHERTHEGSLPRSLVVSVEISRKPTDPFSERDSLSKRYLASTQYIYTIFVDKWIVNWLDYPISLCRGDGRYKQTIPAQNCSLVSQDLSSTSLQLAIRKTTMRHIPNFDSYPKRARRRLFSFDRSGENHVMSNTFSLPDLAFSTCDFADTAECPKLHYLISTSVAPAPFFRTSVLEILPQTTVTNQFNHPLWLREPDINAPANSNKPQFGYGWYILEPGATLELHSQGKGDLIVEVTGIDPSTSSDISSQQHNQSSPLFNVWSSGINLKPSNMIQFRFPVSISSNSNPTQMVPRPTRRIAPGLPQTVQYGLCEAEIRMHRGAKVVRFMKPSLADWIVLNTTGLDLWVEQQGVQGYGEVVPTVGYASGAISERYAGVGVHFACYDPGKEQKLVCKFHVGPKAFKQLIGQLGKGNRRKNDSVNISRRSEASESLMNTLMLKNVLSHRAGRAVRVKGSLKINLSRVESMRFSAVFQLRYGNTVISMRLTAQTCVAFGQKTLHFTAVRIPTKGFLRLNRIQPLQWLQIYAAIKDKLTATHDMNYNMISKHPFKRLTSAVRKAVPKSLCSGTLCAALKPSNMIKCMKRVLGGEERKSFETLSRPSSRSRQALSRKASFNWDYVFQVNVLGLGVAICGDITEELLYISSALIKFRLSLDNDEHLFNLSMGWIQSDVHDPATCYATMLRPLATWQSPARTYDLKQRVQKRGIHGVAHDPSHDPQAERNVITITFNTRGNEYFSVREITNCRIELEPLSLNLDTRIGQSILLLVDEFMSIFGFSNATTEYFTSANVGIFSHMDSWLRNFDVAEYPLKEVAQSQFSNSLNSGTRYNISNLHVGRIALAINIRRSGSRFSSDMQAQNVMIRHLMHIVRRTPHISDANIILAQESLLELCCTPYALLSHFVIRYITQSVQQMYKVLGAVDLIGNPKIVVHHWINGICQAASIMRESLQYLHLPPVAIFLWFRSVSRIGVSAVSGIADALYRLTGSWYLMFNTLALNSDRYAVLLMQDTFGKSVDQPSNVMDGIVFGGQSIGRNLYVSVGNFALKPIHQLLRFFGSVKTAGGVNGEVLLSGVHILGSILSSLASLTFGTVSSLLSGVSVLTQGLLHQIHSVPMLSAIRPQRSVNLLQASGPNRYNFLESWSMSAINRVSALNELLVLLPLDGKLKMFDPVQAATSHWSALSNHMSMISPIAVCTPSSALTTYLWVNRTHVGLIHRRRVRWSCESKWIRSIEIIRVPAMKYQSQETIHYDDSIEVEMSAKAVRKYFAQDTFYLRLIHLAPDSAPPSRRLRGSVPSALLHRLKDESTFPSDDRGLAKVQVTATTPLHEDAGADLHEEPARDDDRRGTLVNRFYESHLTADLAAITIDKYERHVDELPTRGSVIKSPLISPRSESNHSQPQEVDDKATVRTLSVESNSGQRGAIQGEPVHTNMTAEVVRLPSMETAQLYFTLLISVLRESAL